MENILKDYELSFDTLLRVRGLITEEMEKGLSKERFSESSIKMLPSYVQGLPTGKEFGEFLALDLGGTNFRVLLIDLNGSEAKMRSKVYTMSDEIKSSNAVRLFDHIVDCLADFLALVVVRTVPTPLGFTFSFPVNQNGLASGTLVHWTKEIYCSGVVGEDVVKLLQEAIDRKKNMPVKCVALVNDTVGCLMSCAFEDPMTSMAVIIGTGANASYVEKVKNIKKWEPKEPCTSEDMVINMEWGGFGDNGLLDFMRSDVDKYIDNHSIDKGRQTFEKLISGKYLGEIVRHVIVKCVTAGHLFHEEGRLSTALKQEGSFKTEYLSEIESDEQGKYVSTKKVLASLGIQDTTNDECYTVWRICRAISDRSSSLVSAGTAAVLNKMGKKKVTVGVDGSVYRHHPYFDQHMLNTTKKLLDEGIEVKMMLSEDGSGKGAAVIAAVAEKMNKRL